MKVLALAPHNQQLLDFIKLHQPVSADALFAAFDGAGETDQAFRRRLSYLKIQGWLINDGRTNRSKWSINPHQLPDWPPRMPKRKKALTATYIGVVVPPRQYDYMHSPAYQFSLAKPVRLGATDFERCASHGTRC